MGRFYKVKLQADHGPAEVWLAIKAKGAGEAIVIADSRALDTRFNMCDNTITAIAEKEYLKMLSDSRHKYDFNKR